MINANVGEQMVIHCYTKFCDGTWIYSHFTFFKNSWDISKMYSENVRRHRRGMFTIHELFT